MRAAIFAGPRSIQMGERTDPVAEEVRVAALRRDGTLRKSVTIWVVRVRDDLYVRSAYGRNAAWFRGTQVSHQGRIWARGVERDVSFVDVVEADQDIHDQIDTAFWTKYRRYPEESVRPVASAESRSVTLKLAPRHQNSQNSTGNSTA